MVGARGGSDLLMWSWERAGSLMDLRLSYAFFIFLLQRAWPDPTDGSNREASLDLIEGKYSAARNGKLPIPGVRQSFTRKAEIYSGKSIALENKSLSL